MVKFHLPHMYMFLLIISKEKIISIYSTTPPNFSILLGSYETLSSLSRRILWVCSKFFKKTVCFFVALTEEHPESSVPFCQSDIIINFLTIFVPLPIMAVELNQNYKCIEYGFANEEGIRICSGRGTKMVRKLVKRLVRGSGRLEMFRGQRHKKNRKYP